MKMRSVLPMRIAKYGYILLSIVFCIAGIVMLVVPAPSEKVIGNFFGIAMLVFGVVKLIGYYSKDLFRLAFQYDLQFGLLLLVLGLITLINPGNVMGFICISLGICMLAESMFKVKIALEAKGFGIRVWWLTFSLAIITGVMGLLLVFRPSDAMQVMMVLLGISLLAQGILNLSVALSMVKIVKNQAPDIIEADYYDMKED